MTLRLRKTGSEKTSPSSFPNGLYIERDGHALPTATLGLEIPVDPSQHTIVVRAPGMTEVVRKVTTGEGEHLVVELELLPKPIAPSPASTAKQEPKSPGSPPGVMTTMPSSANGPSNGWGWVPWASIGVGTLGLLTGAGAGIVAYTKMHDARALCDGHPNRDCPPEALRLEEQARLPATVATVGVAAGLSCFAVAGGYWVLLRSRRAVVTGNVSPAASFLTLQSYW